MSKTGLDLAREIDELLGQKSARDREDFERCYHRSVSLAYAVLLGDAEPTDAGMTRLLDLLRLLRPGKPLIDVLD